MSIKRTIRLMTIVSSVFAGATVMSTIGCGSGSPLGGGSTNNDQGTSFLAFSYYTDASHEAGLSAINTPLAFDNANGGNLQGLDGRRVTAAIGVQNRLSAQFIRVTRIDCRYEVPGADPALQIPDDSIASGGVVAANGPVAGTPGDPQAGEGGNSTSYIEFGIVGTDIFSYLNVNRNLLPALPFRMIVNCAAVGVTQAGDVIVTNELPIQVNFYESSECCTGTGAEGLGGFQGGVGNGGTPSTFTPAAVTSGDGVSTGTEATTESDAATDTGTTTTGTTSTTGTTGTGDGTIGG